MNADKWIFPLALCFICASSQDERHFEKPCGQCSYRCEMHTVNTPLGSSVLLPCNLTTSGFGWVSWVHASGENLLNLTSGGRVKFLLPKQGRVKVFPNQGPRGNYSIRIDELQDSDLGCYCCVHDDRCHQVDLRVATSGTFGKETWRLIYTIVGVLAFILLVVCSYFFHNMMTQDNTNDVVGVAIVGADNLVYENDDQDPASQQGDPIANFCSPVCLPERNGAQTSQSTVYPSLNQFPFEMVESQRTTHGDVCDRSGKSCSTQHDYVNQDEINNQQTMPASMEKHKRGFRKKKPKEKSEYYNPIYNRGRDQFNQ